LNDGVSEGLERLLIKLTAPTGGATLSSPSVASVYISDPGASAEVELLDTSITISERGFATAVAVVQRAGSAIGEVSVDFAVSNGDASVGQDYLGPANGTVTWVDGDADPKWIDFAIVDDGSVETDEFFNLTLGTPTGASLGARAQLRVDILDGSGANQAPNAVAGSNQNTTPGNIVTLDGGQSNDPDNDNLSYAWTQTLGPTVTLNNANSSAASFVAPNVSSDTLLRFELQVTDPSGLTDSAAASVTVSSASAAPGGSGGGPVSLLLLGILGLAAARKATTRMDAS
jgi:hypothetical protein